MLSASYHFEKLLIRLIFRSLGAELCVHHQVGTLATFLDVLGTFVRGNPSTFGWYRKTCKIPDVRLPIDQAQNAVVAQCAIHLMKAGGLLGCKRDHLDIANIGMCPRVDCLLGQDFLAVRMTANFSSSDMQEMSEGRALVAGENFRFCRWVFAESTPNRLEWKGLDLNMDISDEGVITREGLVFTPDRWTWPRAAWDLTPEMKVDAILSQLAAETDTNPLTSIIKSGHPYKAHGLQIAAQVKKALTILDRP